MNQHATKNPLLEAGLPPFDRIEPRHALPALEHLMERYREGLAAALADERAGWDALAGVEEELMDRLECAWSPVAHLHSVVGGPEWREVYARAAVEISEFHTELDQHEGRFRAYRRLRDSEAWAGLSAAQKRVVEHTLRDFRLSGIDLPPEAKKRYREIARELTELGTRFQQNILEASEAWTRSFESEEALAGLPPNELRQARQRAAEAGHEGWMITLDLPSFLAVITYAEDRALREEAYLAYNTRASDQGPHAGKWDNGPVIERVLTLRRELAQLVGFDHYAAYSLETKMVPGVAEARAFLDHLAARAHPRARRELAELEEFASGQGAPIPLEAWDVAYWAEKLRKARFDVSDEELRPYFPLPRALDGMKTVATELFGLRFAPRADLPTWHPQVEVLEVRGADDEPLAVCYLDLYARKGKRAGAWMGTCRARRLIGGKDRLPAAFLSCNFAPPTDEHPSLLSHTELTTLFHEFGHCLHHMLTRVPHPAIGGVRGVEWDAVELPSQFLENWCWEQAALDRFARHVDTGEPLPAGLLRRMLDARHFQSGMFLVRQLEYGLTDLRLHHEFDPQDPGQVERNTSEVQQQVAVLRYPPQRRALTGFPHLFAGGYAAGYYSYLWAEQLAADAFSRFQQQGVFDRRTGADFRREILEVGGSRDALDSFVAFRGREPRLEPLLISYGIEEA